jgi:hypothetical protein
MAASGRPWRTSCVTQVCMRVGFNNEQELWLMRRSGCRECGGKSLGEPWKLSVALGRDTKNMNLVLAFEILRNSGTSMKTPTSPIREPEGFGRFQQVMAHLGGMTRAWWRHRPIHFAFHWRGICRAISPKPACLNRGEKSPTAPALNTSLP